MEPNKSMVIAVMVKDMSHFQKWLKNNHRFEEITYRPVFSMNSSVGINFNAIITTPLFWKTENAYEIYRCVESRIERGRIIKEKARILKEQPGWFAKVATCLFGCDEKG